MPRFDFWRRNRDDPGHQTVDASQIARSGSGAPIREAERRRLSRLISRRSAIEYDISQAESAFMPANRWNDRVDQLDEAIRQANEDLQHLRPARAIAPTVRLQPCPIRIDVRVVDESSEITISTLDTKLVFREEADWAERGHQLALPLLTQTEGDVDRLVPDGLPGDLRERIRVHLTNGFSIIASDALQRAADGAPPSEFQLDELTRPCDECGNWLDPLGRCPSCTELDWQRKQINSAADHLIDERNDVMAELERTRERLPVFRRQLQDIDKDIAELRAKGVDPS